MLIAILNASTMASNADVELMTQACQIQNSLHCAPAWNQKPATIKFYADPKTVPGYAFTITVIDSDPSEPQALGWHTVEANSKLDGFILCQPILSNGGAAWQFDSANPNRYTISATLSHEVCEAFCDRMCNLWADGPAIAQGSSYAMELADPVESTSYPVSVNGQEVAMSNFVFPSFFFVDAGPLNMPLDYCRTLSKPFSMTSGGYMIVRNAPGSEQQIFGETYPDWKKLLKMKEFSRGGRRSKK